MPIHLHFATQIWSATAVQQYHEVVSDEVTLNVYLNVQSAYHEHYVWGPWAAVARDSYHEHLTANVEISPILGVWKGLHWHFADKIDLIPVLAGLDSYHLHTSSDPYTVFVYANNTYHPHFASVAYIRVDYSPAIATGAMLLPSLEIAAWTGATSTISFPKLTASAHSLTGASSEADIKLPSLEVTGLTGARCSLTMSRLSMSATALTSPLATADITFPVLTMQASALGIYSFGTVILPALRMSATGYTGISANADIKLPAFVSYNTINVGISASAHLTLPWLTAEGSTYETITADLDSELPSLIVAAMATSDISRYCSDVLRYSR